MMSMVAGTASSGMNRGFFVYYSHRAVGQSPLSLRVRYLNPTRTLPQWMNVSLWKFRSRRRTITADELPSDRMGCCTSLWVMAAEEATGMARLGMVRISTPSGSILRIDINGEQPYAIRRIIPVGTDGLDEIWAYGLRNRRFSFDGGTINSMLPMWGRVVGGD